MDNLIVEIKYKAGEKIDGCRWYSEDTFRDGINFDIPLYLTKGSPKLDTNVENNIYVSLSDVIGVVRKLNDNNTIEVKPMDYITESDALYNILLMAKKGRLKAVPRCIVTKMDPVSQEIQKMRVVCFDLTV